MNGWTRFGRPIKEVEVKNSVDPKISYSMSFGEWEAAHAARLDLWKWEMNEYPPWFKARVIAWHRTHDLIEMHKQDALAESINRRSKRRGS